MAAAGWLPEQYCGHYANGVALAYQYERENNNPIDWTVTDGTKRQCIVLGGGKRK